ncbi:hypothetical protein ACQWU4_01180 [Chryseobacterium sp. MIQD13]|uniref:hypothetical protein n=1 Tax=Chryseobacterium sp. MIQD13 TaxID=3422310 RepID=UPI003D2832D1
MKKQVKTLSQTQEFKKRFVSRKQKNHKYFKLLEITERASNFEYTFEAEGIEIYLLDVNGTEVTDIQLNGQIYADRGKPFYLEVRASLVSPSGTGSLQLKDLTKNKDVFASPRLLKFENSGKGGLFLNDIKLP